MGSNCSGKTTVLHALACSFNPVNKEGPSYSFPQFFRPNTDALWKGSDFTIRFSHRLGATAHTNLSLRFSKENDRWSPRYTKRPERHVRFIGIGESVPDIEILNLHQMIHYEKSVHDDEISVRVRDAAGQVLNRVYQTLYGVKYAYRGKQSIGVQTSAVTYSGLSMSSGEQRVFRILDAIFRAPKYGLILVDEIDLFLHQDALQRLLGLLREHCEAQQKQLIFTTHFPPIAQMYDNVSIYSLHRVPAKTVVWRGYSYEAMRHITGTQARPVSCYVEDDVAENIVARVATQLGLRKVVQFGHYGPAVNAFSLCAGLCLSNNSVDHTLVILDGDVYGKKTERKSRTNAVITGNNPRHDNQRTALMKLVRTLAVTKGVDGQLLSPEQVLHRMLHSLDSASIPPDRIELHEISLSVVNVPDRHGFVNEIISHTGESREVALSKIVELASHSSEWNRYTRLVRVWLTKKKSQLNL